MSGCEIAAWAVGGLIVTYLVSNLFFGLWVIAFSLTVAGERTTGDKSE